MSHGYDPDNFLYHYTGASAVVGILLNLQFWATDSAYLNDKFERELVDTELSRMVNDPMFVHTGKVPVTPQLREAVRHHLQHGRNVSILSFSKRGNSLTQFRMYCPPGGGYVLGFTRDYLQQIGTLIECDYSSANLRTWCLDFFNRFAEAGSQFDDSVEPQTLSIYILRNTTLLQDRLAAGFKFKGGDFEHEQEVRLVITEGEHSIRGVAGDSLLLPYQIVKLPDVVTEVSLAAGPNADNALARRSVDDMNWLCRKKGKKWEIWHPSSNHSFRIRHPN